MKKRWIALAVAAVMVGSLTACGGGQTAATEQAAPAASEGAAAGSTETGDDYKLLRFGVANAKVGYDVQTNTNSGATTVETLVTEPLYRWNDQNEEVCVLAEDFPEISEDGLTYTIKLKEGILFSDGNELTSDDVKFTFERMFKPETGATSTYMYNMIQGAKEMLAGEADELSGFTKIDDYTFSFTLEYPFACFTQNLGVNYSNIYPQEACEAAGEDWGVSTLVGSGPYLFESADDTMVVLKKNPNYWGDVHFDEINVIFYADNNTKMMAFENGDIDLCQVSDDMYEQYANTDLAENFHDYTPLGTVFVSMNVADEMEGQPNPLSDVRVREALSLAIDRDAYVNSFLSGRGVVATGTINPAQLGYKEREPYEYNPERAKELLAEAGYADGLTLTAKVRSQDEPSFVVLQSFFAEIGVNMQIITEDAGVWTAERNAGTDQIFWMGWFPLYADADNNIYSYFHSSNATGKSSFYNNPEFDALMDEARASVNPDERQALYEEADEIMSRQDYACLPLYYPIYTFAAKPWVKDFTVGNLIYNLGYDIDFDMDIYREMNP